jgi:purine-binding chemotaxis protein CheW
VRPTLAPPPEERVLQLCAFVVGDEEYAIDIMRVDEILPPQKTTQLPGSPVWITGLLQIRGTVLPVVDVRARLGARPARKGLKPKLLICWIGRRRVALAVDAVTGVMNVRRGEIHPPPALVGTARPPVVGVCGPSDRLRLLLDVKALLLQ